MKCCKVLPKGAPLCVHSCIELISKSEKNPGRAFWNCPEHGFSHFVDIREDKNAATVTKKRKLGTGSNSSNSSSSTSTLVVDIDTVLLAAQKYAIAAGSASQAVEELVVENRRLKAEIVQLRAKIAAMESE